MARRKTPKKSREQAQGAQAHTRARADSTERAEPADKPLLEKSDPKRPPFTPESLDRTVIAIPLLHDLEREKLGKVPPSPHNIIIDLNLNFPGGTPAAKLYVEDKIAQIVQMPAFKMSDLDGVRHKSHGSSRGQTDVGQYVFARLGGDAIRRLVSDDAKIDDKKKKEILQGAPFAKAIYHVWPDFKVRRLTNKSIATVKCDAARASFAAVGQDIVWAVVDSGIDANHPHFQLHRNLELKPPLQPFDFTGEGIVDRDPNGHGTHVAGIIAGEMSLEPAHGKRARERPANKAAVRMRNENGQTAFSALTLESISGMAPRCKLVNMRVLDANGEGEVSSIITALAKIQEINVNGRYLLIQGINLSLGNDFEPEWFACGQSPLCVEVDRLVKSGVVVVVAAGNAGYGTLTTEFSGAVKMGMQLTINDPGNAEQAITVGSTHRDMPHTYGVSYFSSKGPTGDGRLKPDLVAPGEKIISCAAGNARDEITREGFADCDYVEDSGTSMAAPHVSGVIAAFLSIRREFIGKPERVKEVFLSTATNLGRERYFQGNGLVDLMRAIQSV